jgi:SAM-dependent methyltransferase
MRVSDFIPRPPGSLLDVGCNVGAWLEECAGRYPGIRLAGIDINESALEVARARLPAVELHRSGAETIPFADETFDCVTCVEVLEHVPVELRPAVFREMHRVLKPGGLLLLTVPHDGWFAWLDSNNMRHRFPRLIGWLAGRGLREANYRAIGRKLEWHHHFTLRELLALAGDGWRVAAVRRGGLLMWPLMDWACWPFYRLGRAEHPVRRWFERIAIFDYAIDYGQASYGILLVLERAAKNPASR